MTTKKSWEQALSTLCMLIAGLMLSGRSGHVWPETLFHMQVGEVRVLAIPDVARVAVGDGHVINAVTTDEKEVIIFARNEGSTALQVWSEDGTRHHYAIEVAPERAKQIQSELRAVLERIPGLQVSPVGDKLLVEGDDLSDADRERLLALQQRYPQLLDFTGQVGWDRMVLLDVQVVELPRSYLRELGVRWDAATAGGLTGALGWDGGSTRLADRPGEPVIPLAYPTSPAAGYFGINALLSSSIEAMVKNGDAVALAQPQLLARSGAAAEFLAGGEMPYSVVDANGNTNTEFKPYGVSLRITPQIERNDIVRSSIEVEVSSVDPSFNPPGGPPLKTRRAATEFNVRSGQTLVLAGFLSRESSSNSEGLPGLSQIPVLGHLFRTQRTQLNDTELVIMVTPVVVSANHPGLAARAASTQQVLDDAFPWKARMNHPVAPLREAAPGALSAGEEARAGDTWVPWAGKGSQWHRPVPDTSPSPARINPVQ